MINKEKVLEGIRTLTTASNHYKNGRYPANSYAESFDEVRGILEELLVLNPELYSPQVEEGQTVIIEIDGREVARSIIPRIPKEVRLVNINDGDGKVIGTYHPTSSA